jgi:RNA polymerase sigma-32 factor
MGRIKKIKPVASDNVEVIEAEIVSDPVPTDKIEDDLLVMDPEESSDEFVVPEDVSLPVIESDSDPQAEVASVKGALAPARYDSLSAYLNEISRHPMLSKEAELEIAKRYFDDKDLQAAYQLVVGNLWLVVKIARDYERAARSLLDVIQEGNIGLMEAVKNFDPYRGVRFPSYAVWWIKAYILRFVIANWRLVKIGTTQAQRKLFFNLKKEKDRLEREGFSPEPKLLAEKLNVRESDIIEMEQRLGSPDMSVHTPLSHDSDLDLLSTLPAAQLSAEETLQKKEMQQLIHDSFEAFSQTLSERDRVIFEERLLGEEKITLHDLAERFSLSKERVRQLENRVRDKLKAFLLEKMGASIAESLELTSQE